MSTSRTIPGAPRHAAPHAASKTAARPAARARGGVLLDEPPARARHDSLAAANAARVAAIDRSMGMIEFTTEGIVVTANANFLNLLGYRLEEIQGQHHSMFVDERFRGTPEYREFWAKLGRGEFDAGEYKRIGKGGKEVWIQASYNPLIDDEGRVTGVVKFAADITAQAMAMADFSGQVAAIGKSNAVIEFNMDGTVRTANDNFLGLLGYTMEEVRGKHHSMFCEPEYRKSAAYTEFWAALNRGEYQADEFKRIGKGGKECYIQATYNPIRDRDGRIVKVVKYAIDCTDLVKLRKETELFKPMIENAKVNLMLCDLDYKIVYANPSSLATLASIEQYLPVKANQVVGSSIDIFHKNPAHQRALLANDKNLPHSARMKIGPESLELSAAAIYNAEGKYVGAMLNWAVITKAVQMADEFEGAVLSIANVVSASSTELEASAQGMAASSEETSRQAQAVASASEQTTRNVQTVASSAEELSASIREIAGRVQEASQIAQKAVAQAASTTETMDRLGVSSEEIGQVVKVITSIAQQTNLLALNATIEAARAGEAGKGFAVVANEVKELARQTAKATEEIGSKISGVQSETASAVLAIKEIAGVINKINDISSTIASAVEEQNAATGEISRNVDEAARGTTEVSAAISTVTQVASEGGRAAENIKSAASNLAVESVRLNTAVSEFLVKLRSN